MRWPSSDGQSRIVFEIDGILAIYDLKTSKETRLSITVPDDGLSMQPSRRSAEKNIESYRLSPKGERALSSPRRCLYGAD